MILAEYLEELNKWYDGVYIDKDSASIQIVKKIEENLGLTYIPEKEHIGNVCLANSPEVRDDYKDTFGPLDLFNYIYAVLHSPSHREKYKELIQVEFQLVSFPADITIFWQMVRLGGELRQFHLLESPKLELDITTYPKGGRKAISTKVRKGGVK
jgi:predicted helicase